MYGCSPNPGISMPSIRFPLLRTDGFCERLTVGTRLNDDLLPKEWETEPPCLESQCVRDGHCNYVLATIHEKYLHIDLAVCGYFRSPPPAKDDMADVAGMLEAVPVQDVEASVEAIYHFPLSESPDFIRSLLRLEAKVGAVSLKMRGSEFEVGGAPATRIKWSLRAGSEDLSISLDTEVQTKIQESYLEECYAKIQGIFDALFGKK